MEAARLMMIQAGVTNSFWAEAVSTATYLRNQMVSTAQSALKSGLTPYQLWFGKKPDLRHWYLWRVLYTLLSQS